MNERAEAFTKRSLIILEQLHSLQIKVTVRARPFTAGALAAAVYPFSYISEYSEERVVIENPYGILTIEFDNDIPLGRLQAEGKQHTVHFTQEDYAKYRQTK